MQTLKGIVRNSLTAALLITLGGTAAQAIAQGRDTARKAECIVYEGETYCTAPEGDTTDCVRINGVTYCKPSGAITFR
jgi:hypothetical protein